MVLQASHTTSQYGPPYRHLLWQSLARCCLLLMGMKCWIPLPYLCDHPSCLMCCDDITCYENSVLGTSGWWSPASATSITTSTTATTVASSKAPWSSTPRELYTQPIAIIVIPISSMNSILCISARTEDSHRVLTYPESKDCKNYHTENSWTLGSYNTSVSMWFPLL